MEDLSITINLAKGLHITYPKVSLGNLDKHLQKARFYVDKNAIDYV